MKIRIDHIKGSEFILDDSVSFVEGWELGGEIIRILCIGDARAFAYFHAHAIINFRDLWRRMDFSRAGFSIVGKEPAGSSPRLLLSLSLSAILPILIVHSSLFFF